MPEESLYAHMLNEHSPDDRTEFYLELIVGLGFPAIVILSLILESNGMMTVQDIQLFAETIGLNAQTIKEIPDFLLLARVLLGVIGGGALLLLLKRAIPTKVSA